jgi:integrase
LKAFTGTGNSDGAAILKMQMEPAVGFEPTTDGLQNRCSTTELSWLKSPQTLGKTHFFTTINHFSVDSLQHFVQHNGVMNTTSNTTTMPESWPHLVQYGAVKVRVHKRATPSGRDNFMVVYKDSDGKRKFPCFTEWQDAFAHADTKAREMAGMIAAGRNITSKQATEYFASVDRLPDDVTVDAATTTIANCLKIVPDLQAVEAACRFYKARHKTVAAKPVAEVVTELLEVKKSHGASDRYIEDLKNRLTRYADDTKCSIGSVDTASVQAWLNGLKLSRQSYTNNRRVLSLLFSHAVSNGYAIDNPVDKVQRLKVKAGDVEIFTPDEIGKLLAAASPDFLPALAIQAFCGLRSAEVERLEWRDIDFTRKQIILGTSKTKTASRRIIPIPDNLALWLKSYKNKNGLVWTAGHDAFYDAQQDTATAAGVKWKSNALRHSFVSYRLAQTQNAAQTSLEAGNSPQVVFKHYRELVQSADALAWFGVMPEQPANVTPMQPAIASK